VLVMAGKSRLQTLEARADRLMDQHHDRPMNAAIAALPDAELYRLLALGRDDYPAFEIELNTRPPEMPQNDKTDR